MTETIISKNWNYNQKLNIKNVNDDIDITARPYQFEGVYDSVGKMSKITSCTASGKSYIILGRAFEEAQEHQRKSIISVPQKLIGDGFAPDIPSIVKFKTPEGILKKQYEFWITHYNNLCQEKNDKAQILVDFIKKNIPDDAEDYEYVILVTHQTLVRAYDILKENKELKYLKKLVLHIDEAHRIHYEEIKDKDNEEKKKINNKIGEIVRHFITYNKNKNIFLNLVTATFYRNNFQTIVPNNYKWENELFVDISQYIDYCNYFHGFTYNLQIENDDEIKSIKRIFDDEPDKKTIIFAPYGYDINDAKKLKRAIRKNNKHLKIETLGVLNENGNDKKARLKIRNKEVDVIININVATEGFDWPECTRIIVCGIRYTITGMPQKTGRILRDHKTKADIIPEVIQLVCNVKKDVKVSGVREVFNNILKSLGGLMLLFDVFDDNSNKKINKKLEREKCFNDNDISPEEKIETLNKILTKLTTAFGRGVEVSKEEIIDIIKTVVGDDKDLVNYYVKAIKSFNKATKGIKRKELDQKGIKKEFKKAIKGINVADLDIDLISIDFMNIIASKVFNINTFKEIKREFGSYHDRVGRILELKKWVIENNNNSDTWNCAVIKYPSTKGKDIEEVKLAKNISNLKAIYRDNELSQEEIELCEEIPGWKWDIKKKGKTITKICKNCKKEFRGQNKIFCSLECHDSYKKAEKITKTCKNCGEKFKIYKSSQNHNKFCSNKCNLEYKSKDIITKKCLNCEKKVKLIGEFRRKKFKFCSNKCREEYAIVELTCTYCNKKYTRKKYQINKKAENNFCSKSCSTAFRNRNAT